MKALMKHIGIMILLSLALVLFALFALRFYTDHGSEQVEIPVVEGLRSERAMLELKELGLNATVVDTVYKDGEKKLAVIHQNPPAGLLVKPGRKVYLVINSDKIPMVEIPALAGKTSLTQAKNMLSRYGLKLGRVIERPCEMVKSRSDEPVIAQYARGDSVDLQAGSLIERNSLIDLVICVPIGIPDSMDYSSDESTMDVIELP